MNRKLLILTAVAIVAAGAYFLFGRSSSGVRLEECMPETARETAAFAERAFEAYRAGRTPKEKRAGFASMDSELTQKLEKSLDGAGEPEFAKARVSTAAGDPNTYCVDVPSGGRTLRFIVERSRGRLFLAACGSAE